MKRFCSMLWLTLVLCLISISGSHAIAGGPESVLLVVNADSASSKMIANYYIAMRKIPSTNVLYLNGIPPKESMALKDFKETILQPIIDTLIERQIGLHIDYIIYSSDFPTAIQIPEHVNKLQELVESKGIGFNRKLFQPTASINSLTYYAAGVLADDPGYLSLGSNSYYRHSASKLLRTPFIGKLQNIYEQSVKVLESDERGAIPRGGEGSAGVGQS